MNKYSSYAPAIVRIGMSLVFLWFGSNQLMDASRWVALVPEWVAQIVGSATLLVHMNGWFEIVAGLCLLVGFQVRIVSLLLGLHLIGIASGFGLTAVGVRDFGLSIATFSIFFAGYDRLSLDKKFLDHISHNQPFS